MGYINAPLDIFGENVYVNALAIHSSKSDVKFNVNQTTGTLEITDANGTITPSAPTFPGNVTITGNLVVDGKTTLLSATTIYTETLNIKDNTILLNSGETGLSGVTLGTAGLIVDRGLSYTNTKAELLWTESAGKWQVGKAGSMVNIANENYAYSKAVSDSNYLSASTSYYTQAQVNSGFLSANTFIPTDFYSKTQADANFLSASTSFYTQAQTNALFSGTTNTYFGTTDVSTLNIRTTTFTALGTDGLTYTIQLSGGTFVLTT